MLRIGKQHAGRDERDIIKANAAELPSIIRMKPAAPELHILKDDMLGLAEHIEWLGDRWASAYKGISEELGLSPEVIKLYAVGGMLNPERPFILHSEGDWKRFSDLDLVFEVKPHEQSLFNDLAYNSSYRVYGGEALNSVPQSQRDNAYAVRSASFSLMHKKLVRKMQDIAALNGFGGVDINVISTDTQMVKKTYRKTCAYVCDSAPDSKLIGVLRTRDPSTPPAP